MNRRQLRKRAIKFFKDRWNSHLGGNSYFGRHNLTYANVISPAFGLAKKEFNGDEAAAIAFLLFRRKDKATLKDLLSVIVTALSCVCQPELQLEILKVRQDTLQLLWPPHPWPCQERLNVNTLPCSQGSILRGSEGAFEAYCIWVDANQHTAAAAAAALEVDRSVVLACAAYPPPTVAGAQACLIHPLNFWIMAHGVNLVVGTEVEPPIWQLYSRQQQRAVVVDWLVSHGTGQLNADDQARYEKYSKQFAAWLRVPAGQTLRQWLGL